MAEYHRRRDALYVWFTSRHLISRLFKKTFQQGRNERRGDAYLIPYVEPLSDVRTKLDGFFNSLLGERPHTGVAGTLREPGRVTSNLCRDRRR